MDATAQRLLTSSSTCEKSCMDLAIGLSPLSLDCVARRLPDRVPCAG
jgi:hypothetical protein